MSKPPENDNQKTNEKNVEQNVAEANNLGDLNTFLIIDLGEQLIESNKHQKWLNFFLVLATAILATTAIYTAWTSCPCPPVTNDNADKVETVAPSTPTIKPAPPSK